MSTLMWSMPARLPCRLGAAMLAMCSLGAGDAGRGTSVGRMRGQSNSLICDAQCNVNHTERQNAERLHAELLKHTETAYSQVKCPLL